MDVCLRVLKESNKSRFDSYKVRNRVLIISHITFRDCRVQIFSDNLSRNGCMALSLLSLDKLPKTGYQNADVCKNPIIVTKCEFWNPQPSQSSFVITKIVVISLLCSKKYLSWNWYSIFPSSPSFNLKTTFLNSNPIQDVVFYLFKQVYM